MLEPKDFDTSKSVPTADIKANVGEDGVVQQHSYQVVPTEIDKNDFMYSIRASYLTKWSSKLNKLKKLSFPWHELMTSIATLLVGASLSGLISEVKIDTALGACLYVVFPPISAGLIVASFFMRHYRELDSEQVASDVNDEIKSLLMEKDESK